MDVQTTPVVHNDNDDVPTLSIAEFMKTQARINNSILGELKLLQRNNIHEVEPPAKKKKNNDDIEVDASTSQPQEEEITVHVSEAERGELELRDVEVDAWNEINARNDVVEKDYDDIDNEHISGSRYQVLLEQTEEVMGEPIDDNLAKVCEKTWGKAKLSKDKKKKMLEEVKIPENCKILKSPKLNSEIYIRLLENAQSKDRAAQEKQKDIARATIPILEAIGEVAQVEDLLIKAGGKEKSLAKKVNGILPTLQKSIAILNYSFTETTRKRKYDATTALGKQFKPFAQGESSKEFLFDEDTMKKMKSELKALKPKGADFGSKNGQSFGRTQRSHHTQGNYNHGKYPAKKTGYNNYKHYNNSNSNSSNNGYNNNNNNNNQRNKDQKPFKKGP